MPLPKISIITPSFNQGEFIEETIQSVLNQDYPNLEYFIIDGGSSDGTVDIIKKYETKITGWLSEKDSGQSEAINKGLKVATGEIVSWLCSDDLYVEGALSKVAGLFQRHPNSAMIHGKAILFDGKGTETIKGAEKEDLGIRYYSIIPFPQPSSFFRKKLIDEQGLLREDLHFAMDYDLLVRAALNYEITPVDDILSKYRLHEKSKTVKQLSSFEAEWIRVFSKFIRSVKGGEQYVASLKECRLYEAGNDSYNHKRNFTETESRKIVLYFLDCLAHINYQLLDTSKAGSILKLAKGLDPGFYKERNLDKIAVRAKYMPAALIKLLRKISR